MASGALIYCSCGHIVEEHLGEGHCRAASASGWPCDCTSLDLDDEPDSNVRHVHPTGDGIEHDTATSEPDCLCGPEVHPSPHPDGSMGWLIVHHSLDGREQTEA